MQPTDDFLGRTRLLLGADAMSRVEQANIIIFGVGGVGSWCAESLVRSGVKRLTKEKCDGVLSIPMFGKVNSLNASVACGVAVYEVVRQRTEKR